jgi:hypothetical protein|tara:strand:- start:2274 stop:2582 length:309 start_codon:yes stop_codon:yes gene_type:complete
MSKNIYDSQIEKEGQKYKSWLKEKTCEAIDEHKFNETCIVSNDVIIIQVPSNVSDGSESAPTIDTDDCHRQFEEALKILESNNDAIQDGWNEKQKDYARDGM